MPDFKFEVEHPSLTFHGEKGIEPIFSSLDQAAALI
jgi:hypothetical protein